MRILYVTNDLPWPLTSGYLRHYHFIRALSERHDISLFSLVKPGHDPADVTALEPYCERVVTRPATIGRRSLAARFRARAAALRVGGDSAAADLGRSAARFHGEMPFDVVFLTGKRTYPFLAALPGVPLVCDLCDATSTRIRRQARHAGPSRRLPLVVEFLEISRVERSLLRRARRAMFASARDRDAIVGSDVAGPDHVRPAIIPNGVDLDVWHRASSSLGDTIVLTGAMDYQPNADAAIQLASVILPLVRREIPSARVQIVGRDPTASVEALAAQPGVTVTGWVEDVRPYLEGAAVFGAPIRFGAGIQNKVLEAMAMEVPVVASPLAADGLRTEDGLTPPIDVAATPDAFAAALVARLRAASEGAGPDPRLRAYVGGAFDWSDNAARVEALLMAAVRSAGDPRAVS